MWLQTGATSFASFVTLDLISYWFLAARISVYCDGLDWDHLEKTFNRSIQIHQLFIMNLFHLDWESNPNILPRYKTIDPSAKPAAIKCICSSIVNAVTGTGRLPGKARTKWTQTGLPWTSFFSKFQIFITGLIPSSSSCNSIQIYCYTIYFVLNRILKKLTPTVPRNADCFNCKTWLVLIL